MNKLVKPCKDDAGKVMPVVDWNRCGAKGPCIEVCPYGVFEMHVFSDQQIKTLNRIARFKVFIKTFLKGKNRAQSKAVVIKPDQCHACGLCVKACPEKAIQLVAFASSL